MTPYNRDQNQRVALPVIERLRKAGRHVAVQIHPATGIVTQIRPVGPPSACFVPEPGWVVHGPIPYRRPVMTLNDVIRQIVAREDNVLTDDIVEEIEVSDEELERIRASVTPPRGPGH